MPPALSIRSERKSSRNRAQSVRALLIGPREGRLRYTPTQDQRERQPERRQTARSSSRAGALKTCPRTGRLDEHTTELPAGSPFSERETRRAEAPHPARRDSGDYAVNGVG